jgi:integrase
VGRALVSLPAYVGLRPQEALAAVWSDMTGGKLVVDAETTGRTRVVPLAAERAPGAGRVALAAGAARAGGADHRESRGGRVEREPVAVVPAASMVKVASGKRPYDLRHFVSLRIQAGHTVVEVARWAGHSPAVCLSTYAHLFDTVSKRTDADQAIREPRYGADADERRAAG